ncbi:MAG: arginase family hydrolase, arginase/agmainase/formiminoglutamate hydrolase [Bacteroidetes bacterium]|nr:arginase family hydrolase, arginase/agmainase/formiminoglutamate hydrolase [Bacteroidota bacterium]
MKALKTYSEEFIRGLTRKRSGEEKIGEKVQFISGNWEADLKKSSAKFVILGIAEDIGVRANYGRGGANTAYRPALDSFLSQQSNDFMNAGDICILGEIEVDDLMEKTAKITGKTKSEIDQLRGLVSQVDQRVSEVIQQIISAGKIPVIVGGGHNNAYGNIKGASMALNKKINVINCDPHLDFRPLEGRHSGNGFSYAYKDGFVNKYSVFAMHEQYNNRAALEQFKNDPQHLFYTTYESVFVREETEFKTALMQNIGFVKGEACGVEIDLDAITNVPSSAKTSSGISPIQARQYIHQCSKAVKPLYLHIAEGAPVLAHIKADNKTGKLISYLMTDFIKGISQSI